MIRLVLAESSRLHSSSFVFSTLCKLISRRFLREALGEEQDIGGPVLGADVATEESSMLKGLSEESTIKDSNKLEEKFGIP